MHKYGFVIQEAKFFEQERVRFSYRLKPRQKECPNPVTPHQELHDGTSLSGALTCLAYHLQPKGQSNLAFAINCIDLGQQKPNYYVG